MSVELELKREAGMRLVQMTATTLCLVYCTGELVRQISRKADVSKDPMLRGLLHQGAYGRDGAMARNDGELVTNVVSVVMGALERIERDALELEMPDDALIDGARENVMDSVAVARANLDRLRKSIKEQLS